MQGVGGVGLPPKNGLWGEMVQGVGGSRRHSKNGRPLAGRAIYSKHMTMKNRPLTGGRRVLSLGGVMSYPKSLPVV
jgi:hypothetical protein